MKKKLSIIILIVAFASLLIFMQTKGLLFGSFNAVGKTTSPISLFFSDTSGQTKGLFSGILNLSTLQKENAELRHNNNRLQAEVAQLKETAKENAKLRAELKFLSETKYSYEAAEVTNIEPSNLRGVITINRGSAKGLKKGMAVISEGFLIGRISETYETFSKVQLITDPSSAIPVTLQQSNTSGLAKGEIGFGIVMEKIAQGEEVKEGDTVITSGLGGEVPRGLILGYVTKVEKQANSLFMSADIRPATNLNNLKQIIVIKN